MVLAALNGAELSEMKIPFGLLRRGLDVSINNTQRGGVGDDPVSVSAAWLRMRPKLSD